MPKHQTACIYIVDDSPVISDTLKLILQQAGYFSVAFTSPIDLMESVKPDAPDLVLLDVVMPQMSGIELAIQMKATHPNIKVLLFSGQVSTTELLENARVQGYDFDILAKPIHPADLLAAIELAL